MIFQVHSKFDLGQKVFYFVRAGNKFIDTPCPTCNGNYERMIDDARYTCAKCKRGKISKQVLGDAYLRQGTVGKVTIELIRPKKEDAGKGIFNPHWGLDKYTDAGTITLNKGEAVFDIVAQHAYMLLETGVGGGNIYRDDCLYATGQEAVEAIYAKPDLSCHRAHDDDKGEDAQIFPSSVEVKPYGS